MKVNLLSKLFKRLSQGKKSKYEQKQSMVKQEKSASASANIYMPNMPISRENALEFQDTINNHHWLTGESG